MKKMVFILLFGWALLWAPPLRAALAPGEDVVAYRDGRLSVVFRAVPIRKALEQVAAKTGVQFLLDPGIQATLTHRFDGVPLESALRRLLGGNSHALVHKPVKGGGFRVAQVKVYKKGDLAVSRFETIGSGQPVEEPVVATAPAGKSDGKKPVAKGKGGGVTGEKQQSAQPPGESGNPGSRIVSRPEGRVDLHGVDGTARIMAAMAETRSSIALIERKSAGESRALESEIGRTRAVLASGRGDARELLGQLATLEQQKARSALNTQGMLQSELQKLKQLQRDLDNLQTPAQLQAEERAMANRQAAQWHNQLSRVEVARRAESMRQANLAAEQRAAAARRQVELMRQREMAGQDRIP